MDELCAVRKAEDRPGVVLQLGHCKLIPPTGKSGLSPSHIKGSSGVAGTLYFAVSKALVALRTVQDLSRHLDLPRFLDVAAAQPRQGELTKFDHVLGGVVLQMNFRPKAGGLEPMVINARYRILDSRWVAYESFGMTQW